MLSFRASRMAALFAALAATTALEATTTKPVTHTAHHSTYSTHSTSAATHSTHSTSATARRRAASRSRRPRGQQAIEPSRVIEIQQALIREHYLTGEASGNWDSTTIAAMQKYQAANGWQTKLMPDARALKKLGLGPDYSNAINAKNSTFVPPAASSIPPTQSEGFAEAAGVSR